MKKGLGPDAPGDIAVPARIDALPGIVEFVSSYAREMAFPEKRIGEIEIALGEAIGNIVRFACPAGSEEIRVTAAAHETGSIILNIIDTGVPFNMLAMSTFPETTDAAPDQVPSTKLMKRWIRDVEYRRDGKGKKNILAWVISR